MSLPLKTLIPCLAVLLAFALCASDVMAQGPGRGGRQGGGRQGGGRGPGGPGGPGGADNSQRLLRSEAVQRELEMTDEQIELLEEFNGERGRGGGVDREKLRAEMEGLSDEERMEKFKEMRETRTKEQKERLGEILLPHQMDRLSQLAVQASAQSGVRALTSGTIAEKLNMTDEQKEELRETAEELQKEYEEKVAKLRAEMQEKLLSSLTPEQQATFKEITGEQFAFETRRGGGARGRDGRGGGGAGNRRGGGNRGDRREGRGAENDL